MCAETPLESPSTRLPDVLARTSYGVADVACLVYGTTLPWRGKESVGVLVGREPADLGGQALQTTTYQVRTGRRVESWWQSHFIDDVHSMATTGDKGGSHRGRQRGADGYAEMHGCRWRYPKCSVVEDVLKM